ALPIFATFTDPLVDCRTCKLRFRGDQLQQSQCGRRPSVHPGEFRECDLTEARQFNLMFETHVGALEDASSAAYLRPETAQGIFINFKNVLQLARRKPPFGIAQIGKAFRNEITPGNFVFRVREFELMEMEFFVKPEQDDQWFDYWRKERMRWYVDVLGLNAEHLRFFDHPKAGLSHYSKQTTDIEYDFTFVWGELEGVADRTDFDLRVHQERSKVDLTYLDPETNERYLPSVIEPAVSVDRILITRLRDVAA